MSEEANSKTAEVPTALELQSLDAKWEQRFQNLDSKLEAMMTDIVSRVTGAQAQAQAPGPCGLDQACLDRTDADKKKRGEKRKRSSSGESNSDDSDCDVDAISITCDDEDALIKELDDELDVDEDAGQNVSASIAQLVNKRFTRKLSDKKIKKLNEKHARPANCEKLCVPIVNAEIWKSMPTNTRKSDLRSAHTQRLVVRAASAVTRAMHAIREAQRKEDADLVETAVSRLTDTIALLGHASQDLSLKRRAAIKPCLNQSIAAGICSDNVPITEKLFGDHLSASLKEAKELDRLGATVSGPGGARQYNDRRPKQFSGRPSFLGRKNQQWFRNKKHFGANKRQNKHQA